jgi:UDP-2,3-diacylglucosamine pyrophosphatase LpxH
MKIFIISDLHLGGRPHPKNGIENGAASPLGSQICHAYAELTQFIDWVADQGADAAAVELVINGDIVDFLMEDDYQDDPDAVPWLPDEARVLAKLELIIKRTRETNQRGPFEAMADLLARGQLLTFILGNHDVELSLPAVRRYLEEDVFRIGSSGRFRFIYDGEAYVRGDLLIEHGNRYDPWNVIDHSALRQERSMLSRGLGKQMCERENGHFLPPPGSVLVTKVINQVKKKYRFVDLLKPESHVVCAILLAIMPKLNPVVSAILSWNKRKNKPSAGTSQPRHNGQLGATSEEGDLTLEMSLEHAFGNEATIFEINPVNSGSELSASDVWEDIKLFSNNFSECITDKASLLADSVADQKLKPLHLALRKWRNENSISTTWEDSDYCGAVINIGNVGIFNYVVFGHTHLPKHMKIPCKEREITYFNTGTWADTMYIPAEVFADSAINDGALQSFVDALKKNQLDSYIKRQLTYVEVEFDNNKVKNAHLVEYGANGVTIK